MDVRISADSHVVEAAEVFDGLVDRFGDEAPRVVTTDDDVDVMVVPGPGVRSMGAGKLGLAATRLDPGVALQRRPGHKPDPEEHDDPRIASRAAQGYDGLHAGLRDGAERLAIQDADGIRGEVLYPTIFFGIFGLENTEVVVACFRNYNDWMFDYCAADRERLIGLALLPLQDPAAGLAELERSIERGFKGGCIPATSPAGAPYRDGVYEPIWTLAEEAGFPLSLHVGCDAWAPRRTGPRSGPKDPIAIYAGTASVIQRTISELICQGVAHRHPTLQFVCTEWNTGWIPNWLDRLDQGFGRNRFAADDQLDGLPSDYWGRQFHATFEDDRSGVLTRELIGTETLMWGNDFPHRDSTWPCSADVLDEIMAGVPDAERQAMTRDNVVSLYNLTVP